MSLPALGRGHWYSWKRQFYTCEINNSGKLEIGVVTLNIPERLLRRVFGYYQNTHRRSFYSATLVSYSSADMSRLAKLCNAVKIPYICLPAGKDLDQRLETQTTAALVSTTYLSEQEKKQGAQFVCDSCSVMEIGNRTAVVICDGYSHIEEAQEAANVASIMIRQAVARTPPLAYNSTKEKVNSYFQEVLKNSRKRPAGITGDTSVVYYEILRNSTGQRRLVGFNIGDSVVLSSKEGVISYPQQLLDKRTLSDSGYDLLAPTFFSDASQNRAKELHEAQKKIESVRIFDVQLEEGELVIGASDGLLDGVSFRTERLKKSRERLLLLKDFANSFEPNTSRTSREERERKEAVQQRMKEAGFENLDQVCAKIQELQEQIAHHKVRFLGTLLSSLQEECKLAEEEQEIQFQPKSLRDRLFGVINGPEAQAIRERNREKRDMRSYLGAAKADLISPYKPRLSPLGQGIISSLSEAESWEEAWARVEDQEKIRASLAKEDEPVLREYFEKVLQSGFHKRKRWLELSNQTEDVELDDVTIVVTK